MLQFLLKLAAKTNFYSHLALGECSFRSLIAGLKSSTEHLFVIVAGIHWYNCPFHISMVIHIEQHCLSGNETAVSCSWCQHLLSIMGHCNKLSASKCMMTFSLEVTLLSADEGVWDTFVRHLPPTSTSHSVSLDRLRQGISYQFRVLAINEFGYGEPSAPSAAMSGNNVRHPVLWWVIKEILTGCCVSYCWYYLALMWLLHPHELYSPCTPRKAAFSWLTWLNVVIRHVSFQPPTKNYVGEKHKNEINVEI